MATTALARPVSVKVPDWRELVLLSGEELARYDIAAVNLACAQGIPGSEIIDPDYCLYKLDEWADFCRRYTKQLFPQFRRKPQEYENSEAYFRTLCMITVLQRDCGVRYNPAKLDESVPLDTADSFIHGIFQGDGGTCGTMPVVYIAVGRRLGYPLKLVSTRGKVFTHSFVRWDDPNTTEKFNIEATSKGLSTPTDDYYWNDPKGRYRLTPEMIKEGLYLQSKTPKRELASFLATRAWCFEDAGDFRNCIDSWGYAASLVPEDNTLKNSLKRALQEWNKKHLLTKPAWFPPIFAKCEPRRYPGIPADLEWSVMGMWATDNLLYTPPLNERYWNKLRNGIFDGVPTKIHAVFDRNMHCKVDLEFSYTSEDNRHV